MSGVVTEEAASIFLSQISLSAAFRQEVMKIRVVRELFKSSPSPQATGHSDLSPLG